MDVEHETAHYHGWSVALTDGGGIPDHIDVVGDALTKGQGYRPSVIMDGLLFHVSSWISYFIV